MSDETARLIATIDEIAAENVRIRDGHRVLEEQIVALRELIEATLHDLGREGDVLTELTRQSSGTSKEIFDFAQYSGDAASTQAAGRLRALSAEADRSAWNVKAYLTFVRSRFKAIVVADRK